MIEMRTLYDALKMFESADTYDCEYDDGICWDLQDDDDDWCARCATEMAKNIEVVKMNKADYGVVLIADIGAFVKAHMAFMHELSQGFKWPMPDADPENEESVYRGVQIVNGMQAGYACDEDYEKMLNELNKEAIE